MNRRNVWDWHDSKDLDLLQKISERERAPSMLSAKLQATKINFEKKGQSKNR